MYQLFRYLLSFIGIASENEKVKPNKGNSSSSCSFMTESTLLVYKEEDEKYNVIRPNWIRRLSKMAFCHILTWTATEYPTISYDETILLSKDKGDTKEEKTKDDDGDDWIRKIHFIQEKAHQILDPLCSISRPSEQFEMAPRAAELLYDVIKQCSQQQQQQQQQHMNDTSFSTLFGLILLAKQCLEETPMEVRQHFFLQAKLGRVLILDLSSLLKNFKSKPDIDMDDVWKRISTKSNNNISSIKNNHWFNHLKDICKRLEKYDKNWEYREEYQQVITLAKKQFIMA